MLSVGLSLTGRRRGALDVEDLAKGTLSLNFVSPPIAPALQINFIVSVYNAWDDDPSWPYGLIGIFKVKA